MNIMKLKIEDNYRQRSPPFHHNLNLNLSACQSHYQKKSQSKIQNHSIRKRQKDMKLMGGYSRVLRSIYDVACKRKSCILFVRNRKRNTFYLPSVLITPSTTQSQAPIAAPAYNPSQAVVSSLVLPIQTSTS